MQKEIEKKFLFKSSTNDFVESIINSNLKRSRIEQYYLASDPEIRFRRRGDKFFLTVKTGSGLVRDEFEIEITEEQFLSETRGKNLPSVKKVRYEMPMDKYIIEIDIFSEPKGLVLAEIEFHTLEEANNFIAPRELIDVTGDERYNNRVLAESSFVDNFSGRKYLADLGLTEEYLLYWMSEGKDSKEEDWRKEKSIYGFDQREVWSLNLSFCLWLYERLMMYNEINTVDTSSDKFIFKGSEITLQECIDIMLDRLKKILTEKEDPENGDDLIQLFSKCFYHLWW